MIIFFESGRLGNQLFQYCAIKKYRPGDFLLAFGMHELKANFTGISFARNTIRNRVLGRIISRIGKERMEWIAGRLRLMTLVVEERTTSAIKFKVRKGVFGNLVYFKAGYYQSESMVDECIANRIELNKSVKERVDVFLNQHPAEKHDRYFVHVRRGDYVHWPSQDAPAVMELRWYMEQMERIRKANKNAYFFIVSDDKPYAEEFFADEEDAVIVKLDMIGDFAVMTECGGGGVLSASSFAWWASYFVRRGNPHACFIAPRYWAGYRKNSWFPERIQTSWIHYAS